MENLKFKEFDPSKDDAGEITKEPGNYIVTIRDGKNLPGIGANVVYQLYNNQRVIYTGVATDRRNLYDRIRTKHLGNNAGQSTLRKSIGSLFEYTPIWRDKDPEKIKKNKKTKFNPVDEKKLTDWMKENLIFYYCENKDYEKFEIKLIEKLNPPINIEKNYNEVNRDFRKKLKELRNRKPNII